MATFKDKSGKQHDNVSLCGPDNNYPMHYFREAQDNGVSFREHINATFETQPDMPDAFTQFCLNAGLRFKKNQYTGQPAANLRSVLDPQYANQTGGSATTSPMVPDSRLLFAPAIMEAVNATLDTREKEAMEAFSELIARTDTIAGKRWEQPIISHDGKKGPEDSGYKRVAQNARPALMLSITAADKSRTIPTRTIGMKISDEVLSATTLDVISETLVRFQYKADFSEWLTWLSLILNGDPDATDSSMGELTQPLSAVTAKSLDNTITTAGSLTHAAWVSYFMRNMITGSAKSHIVCDRNAVTAIDERKDRPVRTTGDTSDRIDVPYQIIYPGMSAVKVLVMPDGTWPANTLMGLDNKSAIQKVISSSATYEAYEDVVMARSKELRFDRGYLLQRYYDDAFDNMTLTV